MKRFAMPSLWAMLAFIVLSSNSLAQDRAKLAAEIEALRAQLQEKIQLYFAVSDADRAAHAEFLAQPDTGIFRLLPREKYDRGTMVEDGAYYSITERKHGYQHDIQIGLESERLNTSFAGADYGLVVDLEGTPLEAINDRHPAVQHLLAYNVPTAEPEARAQYYALIHGLPIGGYLFQTWKPAVAGHTYLLRVIHFDESDTVAALRVVRKDEDDSLIILWKKLKSLDAPKLERQ